MDNRYIESVISEISPFLEEQGFTRQKNGEYKKEDSSVLVEYDEARQMYLLKKSDGGDYSELSAWLFDDSQTERDAASVGIDFCETLRENLGVKRNARAERIVDMPTAQKDGGDIATFAKKMLDVYPQLKDHYRAHIAKYGNFLYLNFFGENLVPQLHSVLYAGNKKDIKKVFSVFENTYITGDKDTVNAMLACIAAAVCDDNVAFENLKTTLAENTHMLRAVSELAPKLKSNKKLSAALLKK
ncbi:MAG: hypothetical protein J5662_01535 [Clostridia bacterium]|nr:hypothetical protein [Clostridia bacterium]